MRPFYSCDKRWYDCRFRNLVVKCTLDVCQKIYQNKGASGYIADISRIVLKKNRKKRKKKKIEYFAVRGKTLMV